MKFFVSARAPQHGVLVFFLLLSQTSMQATMIDPSRLPASGWAGNVGMPGGIPTLAPSGTPSSTLYTQYCNVLTGSGLSAPAAWVKAGAYYAGSYATDPNNGGWYVCINTVSGSTTSPMSDPTDWHPFNKTAAGNGTTDDAYILNYALEACPNNQWIYLPAATYRINETVSRAGVNNNDGVQHLFSVAIKGDGPALTKILFYGTGGDVLGFGSAISSSEFAGAMTIASGDVRGSTSLVLSSLNPTYFQTGMWATLVRPNSTATLGHDANYMYNCASQLIKVTAINTSTKTVTFWPALNEAYSGDFLAICVSPAFRCGIQDLYVENMSDDGGNNMTFDSAQECWVKDVESYNCSRWHIDFNDAAACEVRECVIHDGWSAGGNADYGVGLFSFCSQCLVENNIFYHCRHAMEMEYGGQGNVFGYNYDYNPVNSDLGGGLTAELDTDYLMGDQLNHGGSMRYNLREGNVAATIKFDDVLGASDHNTVFRNRIQRKGLLTTIIANFGSDIQRWNYNENLVGNVYETQPLIIIPPWSLRRWGTDQDAVPTAVISGATTASPIVITYDGTIGLVTGQTVSIAGVQGNTAANITNGTITVLSSTTFSINGVSGKGAYAGGGTLTALDGLSQSTAFVDGEYDLTANAVTWDPSDTDHILPNSYYLTAKPAFFGNLAWPAFDPNSPTASSTTSIPAGYRSANGLGVPPPTKPYFAGQPANATGTAATFAATVEGYPAPTLQWEVSTDGGKTWSALSNAGVYSGVSTSALQIVGATTALNNSQYECVASNSVGSATSNAAILTATSAGGSSPPPPLPSPVITSGTAATTTTGSSFSYSITASNSPTGYAAAGLPSGLSVNTSTGTIAGTPTSSGASSVEISATNSGGTGSAILTLTVEPPSPVITSGTTAAATAGSPFSYSVTASNSPTSYKAAGLPSGLSVNTGTGVISGTPATAGTYTVTVSATNATGTGSANITVTVLAKPATSVQPTPPAKPAPPPVTVVPPAASTVTSLSARAFVGAGDDILIGGFSISGGTSRTLLIQALGPALTSLGVSDALQHPMLSIHQNQNGQDVVLYSNTGWDGGQILRNAAASAFANPAPASGSADSELLVTLPPGNYTAEISGVDGGTGVALCAIYELP